MPLTDRDHEPMRLAIEASRQAAAEGNMPFGATLTTPEGRVLHVSRNNQITAGDCTGHAETVLVWEATEALGADALRGATVYASGEPCAMCSGAMFWAGITRVVWAASQPELAEVLGGSILPMRTAQTLAGSSPAVLVEGPLMGAEALAVLREAVAKPG